MEWRILGELGYISSCINKGGKQQMNLQKKKLFAKLLIVTMLITTLISFNVAADDSAADTPSTISEDTNQSVSVKITVSDITNSDDPFDVPIFRRDLMVSNFDVTQFGETLSNVQTTEGITYLHALLQLHRELYGDDAVSHMFMLDSTGRNRIFMGRSVSSVLYKNNNYLYTTPQNIPLNDGDELYVCLYNANAQQSIAAFDKTKIVASTGEKISVTLSSHSEGEGFTQPIANSEITNEIGEYILDSDDNIVTTDSSGTATLSFDTEGTKVISMMPQLNYYMSTSGTTTTVQWVPQATAEVVKTGRQARLVNEANESPAELNANGWFYSGYGCTKGIQEIAEYFVEQDKEEKSKPGAASAYCGVVACWECENYISYTVNNAGEATMETHFGYDCPLKEYVKDIYEEAVTTTLVPVYTVVQGSAHPSVTYTTPWCIIEVTDSLLIQGVTANDNNQITIKLKNMDKVNGVLIVAAYDEVKDADGNGTGEYAYSTAKFNYKLLESQTVGFEESHDKYKVFIWNDLIKCTPLVDSEAVN